MKSTKIPLELTGGMERAIHRALKFSGLVFAQDIRNVYDAIIAEGLRTEYEGEVK